MDYSYSSLRSPVYFMSAPCPICRHGAIAEMPMMESLGCNFCNHIFVIEKEPNSMRQVMRMADTVSTLRWVWNGKCWENANEAQLLTSRWLAIAGILLVLVPTLITSLAANLFPTEPDLPLSWFPKFWAITTFFGHLFVVLSIAQDYIQFPFPVYWRRIKTIFKMALPF